MTKRQLRKLMQENNAKSPDVPSVVLTANTRLEAYHIAGLYEEITKEELPFPLDNWQLTIKSVPVELYFLFKKRKAQTRFISMVKKEYPKLDILY